jgi:UDP-N-acetylmuramoyl-tripeptide--D-alanyl-D-alanine ligase
MTLAVVLACAAAVVVASPRWFRIAQREHYLAGSVVRFAIRWWSAGSTNLALAMGAVLGSMSAFSYSVLALVTAVVTVVAPVGLSLKGRTSKLVWTRRLKTLAAVVGVLEVLAFAGAVASGDAGPAMAAMLCFLQPLLFDAGLLVTAPFEKRAARKYVRSATERLHAVNPTTVAITGSYGKTTTKLYVRHLASAARTVLASPASFNNTGGLSRTLNEHLAAGTEVFVAEMGMYGKGEIRAMCEWVRPTIGVIVNIGPVHLERVGSTDGIVEAKSEIVENVDVAVLNVSAYGMPPLADRLDAGGRSVIRVATDTTPARVQVLAGDGSLDVTIDGEHVHRITGTTAQAANVAAALGVVLALDLPLDVVLPRLDSLPQPEHRQAVEVSGKGVTVIDNTFSSNPASAAASLALLDKVARPGCRAVVVTPGMVELGPVQAAENEKFARAADDVATDFVIVGMTNRRALVAGVTGSDLEVHLAPNRDKAVEWVRNTLTDGDAVLYENDLPDHYP